MKLDFAFRILLFIVLVNLYVCVSILYPRKQKVTINTQNNESKVYVDNVEVGQGKTIVTKVKKEGPKQVIVETPDSKKNYYVLLPVRRAAGFWPLVLCNVTNLFMGISFDQVVPKGFSYERAHDIPKALKYTKRSDNEKYISLQAIRLEVTNKKKDLNSYSVNYSRDLNRSIIEAEKAKEKQDIKQEKRDKKKNKGKNVLAESEEIKYDDTKFSEEIYKTLKKINYIDTVNTVFSDNNNTLSLEGVIRKAKVYSVYGKMYNAFYRTQINMMWYLRNAYGELLDSVATNETSGDFCITEAYRNTNDPEDKVFYKMFEDAVGNSFVSLQTSTPFRKHIKIDNETTPHSPLLTLNKPKNWVKELSDASGSSVIVKRKDKGHGSGFAISQDGYLLTNFHVIAGKNLDKTESITVILSNGEEIPATVVRYNRAKDLALLKVEHNFEKPFRISNVKSFKNLMEVYTIGAPKSIELGQTVSIGLLSNERKINNNDLLQVSMSVNTGNSGGPLFEKSGNLHGIVSAKLAGYSTEGIGFAIPSYLIMDFLKINFN